MSADQYLGYFKKKFHRTEQVARNDQAGASPRKTTEVPIDTRSSPQNNMQSTAQNKTQSTAPNNMQSTAANNMQSTAPINMYSAAPNNTQSSAPNSTKSINQGSASNNVPAGEVNKTPLVASRLSQSLFSYTGNKLQTVAAPNALPASVQNGFQSQETSRVTTVSSPCPTSIVFCRFPQNSFPASRAPSPALNSINAGLIIHGSEPPQPSQIIRLTVPSTISNPRPTFQLLRSRLQSDTGEVYHNAPPSVRPIFLNMCPPSASFGGPPSFTSLPVDSALTNNLGSQPAFGSIRLNAPGLQSIRVRPADSFAANSRTLTPSSSDANLNREENRGRQTPSFVNSTHNN